jgi:hypothetical protein
MTDDKFITEQTKILKLHNFQEIQLYFRKSLEINLFLVAFENVENK